MPAIPFSLMQALPLSSNSTSLSSLSSHSSLNSHSNTSSTLNTRNTRPQVTRTRGNIRRPVPRTRGNTRRNTSHTGNRVTLRKPSNLLTRITRADMPSMAITSHTRYTGAGHPPQVCWTA